MADPVQCSQCGARNPADARWCGQCFASLETQTGGGDHPPPEDDPAEDLISAPENAVLPVSAEVVTDAGRSGTATEAKKGSWVCSVCDVSNSLELEQCSACGTSIFRAFGAEIEDEVRVDPQKALLRSLMFPGFGHAYAKQGLLGSAIGGLTLMSLGFGIGLVATGVGSFGWPLLFQTLAVWVAASFDAYRIAGGQETVPLLLRPKVVTALVGSVMLTVILAATLRGNV